jgi:dipeptidyl aminopeptidase/acylaminoacyl peptidase
MRQSLTGRLLLAGSLFALAGCASAAQPATVPAPAPAPVGATPARPAAPAATAGSATPGGFDLSVPSIMRGPLLVGRSPDEVRFSEDSRYVYYRWREPEAKDTTTALYRVPVSGGAPERLADSTALRLAPAESGRWSANGERRVALRNGDVYVADRQGREWRITETPARERSASLSPDGARVYFVSGENVYAVDLAGGPLRQLTDLRFADAPAERKASGQKGALEAEQKVLFGVVRDAVAEREHRKEVDSLRTAVRPVYLGKGRSLTSAEVAPSGRYVLLGISEPAEARPTAVPTWVTESGYTESLSSRPKVGDVVGSLKAAILELATGRLTWLEPQPKAGGTTYAFGWAPTEDRALIAHVPASFKDRWIYTATPEGKLTEIDHLHDDAWVAGPGFTTIGWLPSAAGGAPRVYFISERTGYAHLYTAPGTGGRATALTSGTWEVTDVQLSPDGSTFYLTTSETHPGERNLYRMATSGGARVRLTQMPAWNEGSISPDGRWAAVLHATGNRPPELYLVPTAGGEARQVTLSTTAEFRRGPWIDPEVFTFQARDGAPVHARIYRPRELGAAPNGAAVVFVHGAGYLQNAHKGWSTYFREYMFHHLLASKGYTVLDVDYRGSAGYGSAWRTGIYRHMGGKDLTDQVDGVRWLVEHEGVDPKRVGIYGGSYGGFITLMAMFTEPDVFRSGAALRSVTDWAHYNHGYTARILNQPQDDPEAYRRSSPIYFAEGLKGDLLIAHGMMDTNVEFQDVARLAQRLIELGKTNWEMAVYPVEDHGFTRPESWTDEYRRILELFERTLR